MVAGAWQRLKSNPMSHTALSKSEPVNSMVEIHIHPEREAPRFQPIKAIRHLNKLIADKEDTEQVFEIVKALNGDHLRQSLARFAGTEDGQKRIEEATFLPPLLDGRRDRLRQLPEGTVGRTYVDFMEREGLTAQGLVDESVLRDRQYFDDTLNWYSNWLRDIHDMFHVLTGYGRDALGEASLLAFTHSQQGGRGVLFIAYMGMRQIRKSVAKSVNVSACFHEARRHGKLAAKIPQQDILSLLDRPIETVRTELGIQPPRAYRDALKQYELSQQH
jgi:ubiquinone biosynthesis protein COQ4